MIIQVLHEARCESTRNYSQDMNKDEKALHKVGLF